MKSQKPREHNSQRRTSFLFQKLGRTHGSEVSSFLARQGFCQLQQSFTLHKNTGKPEVFDYVIFSDFGSRLLRKNMLEGGTGTLH